MTQIDTSKWGKFRVGDLFETFHGERLKKSDRIEGSTPFVTAGSENQGVADYIVAEKKYSNAITIDMFGNCFYHDGTLFGDDNIYFLISNNISKYSKLFITTIINSTLKEKYSFSHQFRQKDLDTLTINLPSTPDNFPDWQYMEDYMKEITKLAVKRVEKLKEEKPQTKIDTSNWKKFKVGELFETVNNNGTQVLTGANVPSKELKNGTAPRISVTGVNNGVVGYYDSTHKNYKVYNNFISVNFLGNAFYQENNASLDIKVHCLKLKNKELNKYLALFLVTIINKLTTSYSYANQLSSTSITQLQLPLPITSEGTPDFDYMENYMKNLTEKANKKI